MAAILHVIIYRMHSNLSEREAKKKKKKRLIPDFFALDKFTFTKSCRQIWWRVNQPFILFLYITFEENAVLFFVFTHVASINANLLEH